MRRVAPSIALLLAIGLLCLPVAPAVASPQPDPVCGACGGSFEEVAERNGLNINVTHSTATVQIHANGSATWVVTNRLNRSTAARLSEDPALFDRIARAAATEGWGLPHVYRDGAVTFQSASIDDRTVRIQFRDPDTGSRHAGVLVVDYLHSDGVQGGWILNADRFTLRGPPGTVVVNDPRATIVDEYTSADVAPEVTGGNATWHGTATHEYGATFSDDIYLAYGGAETSSLRVDAALATATAPIWLGNVQAFVLPAVVVYAALLTGVMYGVRRAAGASLDADRAATVVAGLGLTTVLVAVVAEVLTEPSSFVGLGAVYLVTGAATLVRPRSFGSVRGALAVAVASVLAVGVSFAGVGLLTRPLGDIVPSVLRNMVFHLLLAITPVFGLAVARAGRREDYRSMAFATLGALVCSAVAGMVMVPFDFRPWGLIVVFTIGGAILAALLGLPLAVLAARQWAALSQGTEETLGSART